MARSDEAVPGSSLLYMIKQVELAMRAHLEELLRPSGITALQYTTLALLRRRTGLSSAELARNSFVTAQSMADLVGSLERRGLISRHRDQRNRRRLVIAVTEAGARLLDEYQKAVAEIEARMTADLTPDQRRDLYRYLERCRLSLAGGRTR